MTAEEKTALMRIQTMRHHMARTAREWVEMASIMKSPYAKKWYLFFGQELHRELALMDQELEKIAWVDIE